MWWVFVTVAAPQFTKFTWIAVPLRLIVALSPFAVIAIVTSCDPEL
jgi:hypothetical protein